MQASRRFSVYYGPATFAVRSWPGQFTRAGGHGANGCRRWHERRRNLSCVERPRAADEPIPANVESQEALCRPRDADPSALPDFAGYLSVVSEAQRTVPTKVDSIQPAINAQGYAQPSRASRQVSHLFGAAILPHDPNAASRLDRPDQDTCAYAWQFARNVEHE